MHDPPLFVGPWTKPGPNPHDPPPKYRVESEHDMQIVPNLSVACPPLLAWSHNRHHNLFGHGAIIGTTTLLARGHNRHRNHHNTTLWQPIGPGEFSSPKTPGRPKYPITVVPITLPGPTRILFVRNPGVP